MDDENKALVERNEEDERTTSVELYLKRGGHCCRHRRVHQRRVVIEFDSSLSLSLSELLLLV